MTTREQRRAHKRKLDAEEQGERCQCCNAPLYRESPGLCGTCKEAYADLYDPEVRELMQPAPMPDHARARLHREVVRVFGRGLVVTQFAPETAFNPNVTTI